MAHYDEHGFPGGNAPVLRAVLGRETRTLRQYVHELANRWIVPGDEHRVEEDDSEYSQEVLPPPKEYETRDR